MLEHRYDIRILESYVDPNPLMVEIQDPDNFTRFQTRERCASELAAYVFKCNGTLQQMTFFVSIFYFFGTRVRVVEYTMVNKIHCNSNFTFLQNEERSNLTLLLHRL